MEETPKLRYGLVRSLSNITGISVSMLYKYFDHGRQLRWDNACWLEDVTGISRHLWMDQDLMKIIPRLNRMEFNDDKEE